MAQNALTVTTANPTPPTNLIFVGNTAPLDPAQAAVDDGITAAIPSATVGGASNGHTINELASATWPVGITFTDLDRRGQYRRRAGRQHQQHP